MYFSYTILAIPEVEPHAPNTYQSEPVPSGSILVTNVRDPHLGHEEQCNFSSGKILPPFFGMNSLLPWTFHQKMCTNSHVCFRFDSLMLSPMTSFLVFSYNNLFREQHYLHSYQYWNYINRVYILLWGGYLTISVHLLKNPFLDKRTSLLLHWTDWTSEAGIITPNRGVTSMSLGRENHHHGFSWPQFEREDMQITDCMWMFMIKVEFHRRINWLFEATHVWSIYLMQLLDPSHRLTLMHVLQEMSSVPRNS